MLLDVQKRETPTTMVLTTSLMSALHNRKCSWNGVGCSSAQRDSDGDGIVDMDDICSMSPAGMQVDVNGCGDRTVMMTAMQ